MLLQNAVIHRNTPIGRNFTKKARRYCPRIPANNFMGQEPQQRRNCFFCQKNYGVSFQLFDKL
jgi:glutathione peroxidase-family protein